MKKIKIIDDVNLKELEKFGFVESWRNGPCYTKSLSGTKGTRGFILIKCEHKINGISIGNAREIDCVNIDSTLFSMEFNNLLITIFDLTSAGLVEKETDKNE